MVRLKPLRRWIGLSLALLILLAIMAFTWLLATASGRLWLLDQSVAFASQQGIIVEYEDAETPALDTWRFSSLRVTVKGNTLTEINRPELVWAPEALLKGQLRLHQLNAQSVRFWLPPSTNDAPETENASPSIPESPIRITLDNLQIEQLVLPEELTQSRLPERWAVSGSTDLFAPFTPPKINLDIASLDAPHTEFTLTSEQPNPQEVVFLGQFNEQAGGFVGSTLTLPEQPLTAQFRVQLTLLESAVDVQLVEFTSQALNHQFQAAGTLTWQMTSKRLDFDLDSQVDGKAQTIAGYVNPEAIHLDAQLDQLPLDIASPWIKDLQGGRASGKLVTRIPRSPPLLNLSAQGNLDTQVHYQGQKFQLALSAAFEQQRLNIESAQLSHQDTKANAQGILDIGGDQSNLQLQISNLSTQLLETLEITLPEALATFKAHTPELHLRLQGSIDNPQVSASGLLKGEYQEQPFTLQLTGSGNRQGLSIKSSRLTVAEGELAAQGEVDWHGDTTDLKVQFDQLRENLLALIPENIEQPAALANLSFDVSGNAQVKGPLTRPLITTDLSAAGDYVVDQQPLPYHLTSKGRIKIGKLNQMRIAVDNLNLQLHGESVLLASGQYREDNLDLQVDITRLPTNTLATLGWPAVSGELQANFALRGSFLEPSLTGQAQYQYRIPAMQKNQPDTPAVVELDVQTQQGHLTLTSQAVVDDQTVSNLTITFGLAELLQNTSDKIPLNATIKGQQNLAIARWFINPDAHQIEGQLTTDLRLGGTLDAPRANGRIELAEGYYANQATITEWRNIEGLVNAEGQRLEIDHIRLDSGDSGWAKLVGHFDWSSAVLHTDQAIDLKLTADDTNVLQRNDLSGHVSGDLSVNGGLKELWVAGTLDIAPFNANIDAALQSSIPSIKVTETQSEEDPVRKSIVPVIHLDVTIKAEQQAYIRGRGLVAELEGQIVLRGTADNPDFTGVFKTRRGRMDLFGRRFRLQQGEVRFANDVVSLLIPAEYTSKDNTTFKAEVYGTSDEPKVRLSSNPTLPEDEIVSRLIFGKSVADITPFQAIQLASTINTLKNGGGFDPVESARNLLGVDSLEIDSADNEEGGTDVSVGVGKYVNERVFMQFKKSTNAVQPWEASVEVELTPRYRLEGTTTEEGNGEVMLLWTKDY